MENLQIFKETRRLKAILWCCKMGLRLLNNELTKKTQRSIVFNIQRVLHGPIKGQGTPSSRGGGSPQVQQYYNAWDALARERSIGMNCEVKVECNDYLVKSAIEITKESHCVCLSRK